MNELEVYAGKTALEIFQPEGVTSIFDFIKKEATDFTPDTSTDKGRKQIASQARKVSSSKVVIDNARKLLVEEWTKKTTAVNEQGKILRDQCDTLRDEIRQPLSEWETAEKEREERKALIREIEEKHSEAVSENALFDRQKEIERKEAEMAAKETERVEKETADRAEKGRVEREAAIKANAIQEEKERQEQAVIDANEATKRAEREKIEAEERAKIQAEQAAKQQAEAVENAKIQEQQRLQKLEDEKKQTRIIEEAKQKKAAENKSHQKAVNNAAVECLVMSTGINADTAKKIVIAIAKGDISQVTINY